MQSAEQPRIVHSFADGWAVYKPTGFLTRPEDRSPGVPSVLDWARRELKASAHLVHRLDRETSGVLIIASSPQAAARWTELFEKRLIQKTYFALAWGAPTLPIFKVDSPLDQKKAVTQVQVQTRGQVGDRPAFAARIQITTGRVHQIRRHLSERGFPLWNDSRYGGAPGAAGLTRVALHAWFLEVPGWGRVHCPLPLDLRAALESLAGTDCWQAEPWLQETQRSRS